DAYVDQGFKALEEDEIELGCRQDKTDEDAREVRVVAQMLPPPPNTQLPPPPNTQLQPPPNTQLQSTVSFETDQDDLGILWEEEWESDKEDDPDKVFYGWERSKIFNIVGERHREIFDLEPAGFMVKGATPEKMLEEYTSLVRRAIREEDFSMLLSDVRHFQLVVRNNGLDHYVTSGPGLEKEVMNLFFKTNLDDRVNHYLVELIDDYTTISAMPLSSSTEVSQSRLQDLTFFGAVVGLSLVHGSYPANINPLLLVYLLNHSNLKSISKHLVMDQFPTLYHTLARWKALDPRDNNLSFFQSHFASYHNVQVCHLRVC
ncbi:hypothetical protein FB446DRAFT_796028, partial [Lentinula raphanica]